MQEFEKHFCINSYKQIISYMNCVNFLCISRSVFCWLSSCKINPFVFIQYKSIFHKMTQNNCCCNFTLCSSPFLLPPTQMSQDYSWAHLCCLVDTLLLNVNYFVSAQAEFESLYLNLDDFDYLEDSNNNLPFFTFLFFKINYKY